MEDFFPDIFPLPQSRCDVTFLNLSTCSLKVLMLLVSKTKSLNSTSI